MGKLNSCRSVGKIVSDVLFVLADKTCSFDVYELVQELHGVGVLHGDLEPRNIGRTREGDLCLIDFSESVMHVCPEEKVIFYLCWLFDADICLGQEFCWCPTSDRKV